MVDRRAAKVALLVGGGVLAFLLVGAVLRFLTRIATFAGVVLLAVVLAYVAYEALTGWRAAGADAGDERAAETDRGVGATLEGVDGGVDADEAGLDEDASAELDRELDELLDDR